MSHLVTNQSPKRGRKKGQEPPEQAKPPSSPHWPCPSKFLLPRPGTGDCPVEWGWGYTHLPKGPNGVSQDLNLMRKYRSQGKSPALPLIPCRTHTSPCLPPYGLVPTLRSQRHHSHSDMRLLGPPWPSRLQPAPQTRASGSGDGNEGSAKGHLPLQHLSSDNKSHVNQFLFALASRKFQSILKCSAVKTMNFPLA